MEQCCGQTLSWILLGEFISFAAWKPEGFLLSLSACTLFLSSVKQKLRCEHSLSHGGNLLPVDVFETHISLVLLFLLPHPAFLAPVMK